MNNTLNPDEMLRTINDEPTLTVAFYKAFGQLAAWLGRGGSQPNWDAYPRGTKRYRREKGLA